MFNKVSRFYSCEELLEQAYSVQVHELEDLLGLVEDRMLSDGDNSFLVRAKSVITTRILLKSENRGELGALD